MTSSVRCRPILSLVGAVILWPRVTAQGPGVPLAPATPDAEHFTVGATCGVVPGAIPWGLAQVRIDAPVIGRWFIDGDVGAVFGTDRIDTGQVPTGAAVDVQAKWMYGARATSARAGYVFFGRRVIGAKNIDQRGQVTNRRSIVLFDIGWGWIGGSRAGGTPASRSAGAPARLRCSSSTDLCCSDLSSKQARSGCVSVLGAGILPFQRAQWPQRLRV